VIGASSEAQRSNDAPDVADQGENKEKKRQEEATPDDFKIKKRSLPEFQNATCNKVVKKQGRQWCC